MSDNFDHTFAGHDHGLHTGHDMTHHGLDSTVTPGPLHPLGSPFATAGVVHGNPAVAERDWFHQTGEDCVPASVTQVLAEATGHPIPNESEVLQRMQALHLQMPTATQGVPFDEAKPLLESFGISCDVTNSSVPQLEQYLDEGRSAILYLNAEHIWHEDSGDPNSVGRADHAVLVTSIDPNAPANDHSRGVVTLSDTGNPHGNEEHVPLHLFEEAWAVNHNHLVVTEVAAHAEGAPPQHPGPVLLPTMTINPHAFTPAVVPGVAGYTVQPGDTLWNIAEHQYGDGSQYHRIAEANGIVDPSLIHPGQELIIPK